MKPLNILVVDDNISFASTLRDILESEGYRCRVAHSADEAEEIISGNNIDCVISDQKMPGKSGIEFFYEIQKDHPDLPFILVTAYASDDQIQRALEFGMVAVLQKPLDIKNILRYFSHLTNAKNVAVISENKQASKVIEQVMGFEKFNFIQFNSVESYLASRESDFRIAFLDYHMDAAALREMARIIISHLPSGSVLIHCDILMLENDDVDKSKDVHLVSIPMNEKNAEEIKEILSSQFLNFAQSIKNIFPKQHE